MDINRRARLARAYALCEWPCLIGVVCAIALLSWQSSFAPTTPVSTHSPSLYDLQRSLSEVDSNCRQELYYPSKQGCTTDCSPDSATPASTAEIQDFGWSILTCSDADRYHDQVATEGSLKNLVIEVIKTNRSF